MIYLDNAATTRFIPQCVYDALFSELTESSNPGRASHSDSIACAMRIGAIRRALLTRFSDGGDYTLVFTSGCTESLNLAILGMSDRLIGAHVVTTVTEHNSVLRPLHALVKRGARLSIAKPSQGLSVTADDIRPLLRADTALVALNCVSNVTGARNDVQGVIELCREREIPLLLDGAQSLGHDELKLTSGGVMLAGAGHKALHGLQGSGFLIFDSRLNLTPIRYGGTGTYSDSIEQPTAPPDGFESGTLNAAAIIALGAGAQWSYANRANINARFHALTESLIHGLTATSGVKLYSAPNPYGVVSFNVNGFDSSQVADYLDDNGVAVRGGLHCAPLIHEHLGTLQTGAVRISVGYETSPYQIERVAWLIKRLVNG